MGERLTVTAGAILSAIFLLLAVAVLIQSWVDYRGRLDFDARLHRIEERVGR